MQVERSSRVARPQETMSRDGARRRQHVPILLLACCLGVGCMVGPNFHRPTPPTAAAWRDAGGERLRTDEGAPERWWRVFDDPVLDDLIAHAYRENLPLRAAALRVVEAQALRGIAFGNLFPQTQELNGSLIHTKSSLADGVPVVRRDVTVGQIGFDATWELDLWGRFRRDVESADARLLAALADYDDVLVSLVGEVGSDYVQLRVLEARLGLARDNVRVQRESLDIARVRYEAGGTSNLDVQQATTLLADTEATIPQLESQARQTANALAVLLGVPASDLPPLVASEVAIPVAPPTVTVGIPADLLRRRPDVRRAEHLLAAQSAQIGVAVADLLPHVEIAGSIGLSADTAKRLFEGDSLNAIGGPQFVWPVLNYGRLLNKVRLQDATFQELVATYGNTVLQAQRDVENALVGYVNGAEQVTRLTDAVTAADKAVDLSLIQYREGAADYTTVLNTQQAKLREDDSLASARGGVTLEVIALYKALGGGWELRQGQDVVPEETKDEMKARMGWPVWR
jgi:NodT family efflux transporter outer membrane factor (OMF) lipoprotein